VTDPLYDEHTFASTTIAWKIAKIRRPAGGQGTTASKTPHPAVPQHRWFGLPALNPRKVLHLSIKDRGGPEAWVEIHARGRVVRYPGYMCIADILRDMTNT
jgi:hypothetical protein